MLDAIDWWYNYVFHSEGNVSEVIEALKLQPPHLCSITFERTCNLQCAHCIYQAEKSSRHESDRAGLCDIVQGLVNQIPSENGSPTLLHEGRILRPWHIESLRKAREQRPNLKIGLIDNGTYLNLINQFRDLKLDWIDISIDGTEQVHNLQRRNNHAWQQAQLGLRRAREVVKPAQEGGAVNTLFTVSELNYHNVSAAIDSVLGGSEPLADGMDVITMSPSRTELKPLEITAEHFAEFWQQLKQAAALYNRDEFKVFFRIYYLPDLVKLSQVVGRVRLMSVLRDQRKTDEDYLLGVETGRITFMIDGVLVTYYPISISVQETFLVDADGQYRLPYSISYTLEELRRGVSGSGNDIEAYTVAQLNRDSSLTKMYNLGVDQWWQHFGQYYLANEKAALSGAAEHP